MLKFVALAAALAFSTTSAMAQAPSAGTAPPAAKVEDPNKKICQRVEEIGTRLGDRRVCKTKAEWAAERAATRNDVERAQQNASYKPAG